MRRKRINAARAKKEEALVLKLSILVLGRNVGVKLCVNKNGLCVYIDSECWKEALSLVGEGEWFG